MEKRASDLLKRLQAMPQTRETKSAINRTLFAQKQMQVAFASIVEIERNYPVPPTRSRTK